MGIRVENEAGAFSGMWVEFRDDRWPFRDRNRILEASSDRETLEIVLGYITAWRVTDVDGAEVPLSGGPTGLDNVDDAVVSWLIGAWFEAKARRVRLPLARSAG